MTHQYMELKIEELEKRIEALEQEPSINKPCVSGGVCEHDKQKVLDKIRAEIEEKADGSVGEIADGLYDALEIIDKYKAETEAKDGNDD